MTKWYLILWEECRWPAPRSRWPQFCAAWRPFACRRRWRSAPKAAWSATLLRSLREVTLGRSSSSWPEFCCARSSRSQTEASSATPRPGSTFAAWRRCSALWPESGGLGSWGSEPFPEFWRSWAGSPSAGRWGTRWAGWTGSPMTSRKKHSASKEFLETENKFYGRCCW